MTPVIVVHAVLATALLGAGLAALRLPKRRGSRHGRAGDAYFALLVVALPTGMVVGARDPALSLFELATPPTLALGVLGWTMAKRRPRRFLGSPWIAWHVIGQAGSFIGVMTATGFQTVGRLAPGSALLATALWVVPTVVGSVAISRTLSRRLGDRRAAPA